MKKIISLTLALAIVLSMSVCAFATTVIGDGNTAEVALSANITKGSTLISVTMPTTIAFQISTKKIETGTNLAEGKDSTAATKDGGYIFDSYTAATGTVENMAASNTNVNVSLVGLSDPSKLTNKIDLFLAGPDATNPDALDTSKNYNGADTIELIKNLGVGKTATLSVSAAKANPTASGAKSADINLPTDTTVSVVATLKVTAVAE